MAVAVEYQPGLTQHVIEEQRWVGEMGDEAISRLDTYLKIASRTAPAMACLQ